MAADGGGGIVAPDLFPMLIDERGSRRNRLWEQIQSSLGADTNASGCRRGRMRAETRLHAARRSLASRHRHLPKKKRDSSISFSKEMFNGYWLLGRGCNFALVSRRDLVWHSLVRYSVWNARQRIRLNNQNC